MGGLCHPKKYNVLNLEAELNIFYYIIFPKIIKITKKDEKDNLNCPFLKNAIP